VSNARASRGGVARFLLLAAACALATACSARAPRRPDVVLIVVDSLRADHLSHLGYEFPTAASLDGFRADAALFAQAYAPAPSSAPSTATLLTGLLPARHRLGHEERIAPGVETLASRLRAAGYATLALSHHARISDETGLDRGFERFQGTTGGLLEYPDASQAVAFVREFLARDPPRPFFLYLHLMNVHGPYRVPPDRQSELLGRPPLQGMRYGDALMRGVLRGVASARAQVTTSRVRSLTEQYDTAARYALDRVAEILRLLEHAGVYRDALIVLAGDHGDELFEHGSFGHGATLYREVLQVPLYVKPPGGANGLRYDEVVGLQDVAPTLLELLGLPALQSDGISFAAWLRGGAPPPSAERALLFEIPGDPEPTRAIAAGRYKLIRRGGGRGPARSLLYDRVLDPRETADIAAGGGELVAELSKRLDAAFAALAPPAPGASP
jgi:arylsulfatase A-like enzyme